MDQLEAPRRYTEIVAEKSRIAELRRRMVAIRHQQIVLMAKQAAEQPFDARDLAMCRGVLDAHHMVRAIDDDEDDRADVIDVSLRVPPPPGR